MAHGGSLARAGVAAALLIQPLVLGVGRSGALPPPLGEAGVIAWGANRYGQLGVPEGDDQRTPVVSGLGPGSGIAAIDAGGVHNLAIRQDGVVLAWGSNGFGQLGIGTSPDGRADPAPPASLAPRPARI